MKRSFGTKLRQIWTPKEFRLPEPEFTKEQLDSLEELIQMAAPKISRAVSVAEDERARMVDFLVDLGTGIWWIGRKMDGLSRMPREIRDALYALESMWAAMSRDGVEIVDHIGGTPPSEREAKIAEVREIPGLTREQVVDAMKPTIIFNGEIVQMGEIVVGRPPYAAVGTAGDMPPIEAERETPAVTAKAEEVQSAEDVNAETPAPKKTGRGSSSAETDAAPKNDETPDEKPAVRKTRASAARKPRKTSAAPPKDTDVAPKEEA
ncbi:MAG: hypothetical protein LBE65_06775 [Synergistaceae bacterium]|nr:hypothetical protein [Synergistaceae bacterium]